MSHALLVSKTQKNKKQKTKQASPTQVRALPFTCYFLDPPLPAIDDCHSYDSATAKHELVYDGVDTDVYVEDLESGSQEVNKVRYNIVCVCAE